MADCAELQNSLVFVDADDDDSIEVVPDSRENTVPPDDAAEVAPQDNTNDRADITLVSISKWTVFKCLKNISEMFKITKIYFLYLIHLQSASN